MDRLPEFPHAPGNEKGSAHLHGGASAQLVALLKCVASEDLEDAADIVEHENRYLAQVLRTAAIKFRLAASA